MVGEELEVKKEYLEKLDKIRKQRSLKVGNLKYFKKRYGLG